MCRPPPPPSLAAAGYPTGRPAEQEHLKERFIETIWVFFKNLSNLCKKNRSFVELVTLILQDSVESFGGEDRTLFQWFQPCLQGQMELPGGTHSTLSPWLRLHRRAEPWCCQGRRRQVPCPKVPKVTSYLGWKRGYKLRAYRLDLVKGYRNAFCLVFYNALRFFTLKSIFWFFFL